MRSISHLTVHLIYCCIFVSSCTNRSITHDDGDLFARSRIEIDGEREWTESKRTPGHYHIPQSRSKRPSFDDLILMDDCVRSYVEDGNISGIRGAFLMAYTVASIPHRSGDVMGSYSELLYHLLDKLGDEQFASSLSKMRPEVQSAVFYLLLVNYWPTNDPEWNEEFKFKRPHTYLLEEKVNRLKWPHDYEKS